MLLTFVSGINRPGSSQGNPDFDLLCDKAIGLISSSLSSSTGKAYNATLSQLESFVKSLGCQQFSLPVNPGHIVLFITDLYH